jgi:hypothetical protein
MRRLPYSALQTSTHNMTIGEISNRTMIKYKIIINVENLSGEEVQVTFKLEELIQTNWKLNIKKHKVMNKKHVVVNLPKRVKKFQGHVNCEPECNIYVFVKVEYEKV